MNQAHQMYALSLDQCVSLVKATGHQRTVVLQGDIGNGKSSTLPTMAHEMPDHLPVVLEYASTQPPREAQAFLAEMAHIFNVIFSALVKRQSRYASVLGALIELAGEKAQAVKVADEEPIDDSWAEPAAFDGCSTAGQSRAGKPQPIQIVRANADRNAATGARP